MNKEHNKIKDLDTVLDKLVSSDSLVSINDFQDGNGNYFGFKENDEGEKYFKELLSVFEKLNIANIDLQFLELTSNGTNHISFKNDGGFKKYFENIEAEKVKQEKKEVIDKRKNILVNFKYFIERPKTIIGIILIILAFGFGITNLEDIKDYFQEDKEKIQKTNQESMTKGESEVKELEILNNQVKSKESIESEKDSLAIKQNY